MSKLKSKFDYGVVVQTKGIQDIIDHQLINTNDIMSALQRHLQGDWGLAADPRENDKALKERRMLLSVYKHNHMTFWIITDACRLTTTILLPTEY